MTFYEEMVELVVEMLDEFGANGVLVRTGPDIEQWNPDTEQMETVGGSPLSIPVRASVGPIPFNYAEGRETTPTVAVMREKPAQGDTLEWGEDERYIIGNVTALPLQGRIVAFMAEVA